MTVQAAWWTVTLSAPEMGNCGFQACSCADTVQEGEGLSDSSSQYISSLSLAVNLILATQSSESCLLPLGLEHLLAFPWSFAPESWTGWDPKGALGPRGQQVKGEYAQPPASGAQLGLDPKQEAGTGTSQPWRRWLQPFWFQKSILSLSRCFPASLRWFGELLLKSSSRSPCLCVF